MSRRFTAILPSRNFLIPHSTFTCLIHFVLISVSGIRYRSMVIPSVVTIQLSHHQASDKTLQYSCLENPMDRGVWQARPRDHQSWSRFSDKPPLFMKETVFSWLSVLGALVKCQLNVYTWDYFSALDSVTLLCSSVFMPVSYYFDEDVQLEITTVDGPRFVLLSQNFFGYSGYFVVSYKFLEYFSTLKHVIWKLITWH